ncbi:testis-expressed sequence 2 -like protein [Labeo rohita]|uniref:Testis-expressed sequence 2-like protein n=1 Tax=Labeo rohita TaxID=84645 RepID=A0A498LJ57_LABRO|nr:testis-expressed sequence 2 -like protein [Labeo rohita]
MVTCKETCAAIIALHKNGFTGKDIVATKIAPKSTIYRIIKNFKERGSILVKKASGRPRKSSKRQDHLLKRIQLRDRRATSAELAQEWQQAGVSASARTVRRRLLEDGLVSRRAAKKPLLSKKNIRDRLIFCKKYGEWTAEDWGKVIFSDEASFRLFGASGKRLVRRRKGILLCIRCGSSPWQRRTPESALDLYTWLEYENSKDSNIVASALQHYFTTVARDVLHQCQGLRLFSDSCYGQNKNINVLSMLFALHSQLYPQLNITYFFPIRGHSFLPADRVFGRIEQDIQKQTTILLPEEYNNILQKHGTVY